MSLDGASSGSTRPDPLSPQDGVEREGALQTLERGRPGGSVDDGDVADKFPHARGDEDLPAGGLGRDAGRENHAPSVELTVLDAGDTHVDPRAHVEGGVRMLARVRRHVALDRHRTPHRGARVREDDHEAVTLETSLLAAVLGDLCAHEPVVLAQHVVGAIVPDALEQLGRGHEVGEHDRDRAVGRGLDGAGADGLGPRRA